MLKSHSIHDDVRLMLIGMRVECSLKQFVLYALQVRSPFIYCVIGYIYLCVRCACMRVMCTVHLHVYMQRMWIETEKSAQLAGS